MQPTASSSQAATQGLSAKGLYIGTSGWSHPQWRGTFYPADLAQGAWLNLYAQHFHAVEVNSSFYRPPQPAIVERWAATVPDDFKFCFKIWRNITHMHGLGGQRDNLDSFLATLAPARAKAGPLLLQLPPQMEANARAKAGLEDILSYLQDAQWRVAVEFRHVSWNTGPVYALCRDKGASLVVHDMPPAANMVAGLATASAVNPAYVRLHGEFGRYHGSYDAAHLERLYRYAAASSAVGHEAYIFFNNTLGTAVDDARSLQARLAPI